MCASSSVAITLVLLSHTLTLPSLTLSFSIFFFFLQLPSGGLHSHLVVVVSPLIALMVDQLANLPSCVPGACLHMYMSHSEQEAVLQVSVSFSLFIISLFHLSLFSLSFNSLFHLSLSSLSFISFFHLSLSLIFRPVKDNVRVAL